MEWIEIGNTGSMLMAALAGIAGVGFIYFLGKNMG